MDLDNKDNINNDLNGEPETPEPPKKRGRKPGSGKKKAESDTVDSHTDGHEINENAEEIHEESPLAENDEVIQEEPHSTAEPVDEKPVEISEEIPEASAEEEIKTEESGKPETDEQTVAPAAEEENVQPVSESNYQVSLVDENVLMVKVATLNSVLVECSVKDKTLGKTSEEIQSNKIFIHPVTGEFKQEVEVLVTVGALSKPDVETPEDEQKPDIPESAKAEETAEVHIKEDAAPKVSRETNYQVTLIDENILRIKIPTKKSVSIDSSVKDTAEGAESEETQSNRIFIHPKSGTIRREVEIHIRIGAEESQSYTDAVRKTSEARKESKKTSGVKLVPNPIVADLIDKFREPKEEPEVQNGSRTPEEILEDRLGKKNPWRIYHRLLERNLFRGAAAANVIAIIAAIIIFTVTPKTVKEDEVVEQKRLIVMQDLPENLNQQQNVEDPNRPPDPPKDDGTTGSDVTTPKVTTPKIRPPKINVPKVNVKQDTNIANLNSELDSLRKKNITGNNGTKNGTDTGKVNTSLMPDSLLKNLTENEVGLVGKFPPNWKQIDSRSININQKEFSGIILVDTTAKKKEEALNMSIQLDTKGDYWKQFQFKNVLAEDSLRTIYSIDPKIEAKLTYYRFYVASKIDNVFIAAYVEPSVFEKYKPEIEQVVKTIRISKPEKK